MVEAQKCPHGWLDRPGSATYYSFRFKQKKSWSDARLECQRYDGELLKIETDKEKVWVLSQIHHIENITFGNDGWWTGLNKREQGDVTKWVWADGVALEPNLIKWAQGEPNNYLGQEHCAEIWQGMLYDKNCDHQLYYSCEIPKSPPLSCDVDDGWEHLGANCYKFMSINRNYEDATYICTQYDASLVVILNEEMQQMVTDLAKHYGRNSWLGLHDVYSWNRNMALEWTNGSSLVKTWWSDSVISNHTLSNTSSCVILNATKNTLRNWEYADCTKGSSFICTKQSGMCSDGWVQRQGQCYFFFSQKTMSWKDSVAFCNLRGAMLIQMNRADNIEFLSTELRESFGQDVDSMWIGISGKDGTWSQLSGDAANVTSSMWAENVMQTDTDTNVSTKCAYILRDDRDLKWQISADCSIERGVICTAPSDVLVQPPFPVFPEPKCMDNWLASLPNCFKVNTELVTWFEARFRCQQDGGDLAVISNERDQKLLSSEIQQDVWIGLNDREQENKNVWLDRNDQASMIYWRRGEPDNKIIGNMYTENCIAMGSSIGTQDHGKWIDYPCAFKLGFVREWQ
ncbi:hypothetical protein CHS0354_010574 [Potamilus streckersoni]|uniref:C-type lectin domain-containing protein n=1 Tax=Potamilus streckersoni TaxID=2493646 RepID=A0AAE0VQZ4_9BIVA|nr:hypothetical protein CHS0354_010574 [Potamilus streckersoni]